MKSANGNGKTTIKDVARIARVSISTVSRALSKYPTASKKTIERIMRIAEEINYYPDSLAKGLRNRRTFTIGLILNDLNNPFYTEILGTVGEVLMRQGYSLLISYSQYNAEQEKVNIRTMLSKRVDGIIISPISSNSPNIAMLRDCGLAFVLIDCYPPAPDVNCVYSEHRDGAILATEHLIAKGHQDILLFTGPANVGLSSRFIQGYRETLERRGIPIRDELIIEASGLSMSAGYEAFKGVLTDSKTTNHAEFTAVVTCSDLLAIGIYKVANDLGFRIPDDYSIVGYDNIEVTSALSPPLTTIHQPRERIGRESIALLLRNTETSGNEARIIQCSPHLVKRGSVRNLH